MTTWIRAVVVAMALSLASGSAAAQSEGSYVAGGLVGTFFGFGLGHAINGRYGEVGVTLTVGELLGTGAVFGSLAWMGFFNLDRDDPLDSIHITPLGITILAFGGLTYTVLHIFEIVDVWRGPAQVAGSTPGLNLALVPYLGPGQRGLAAVLRF